MLVAEVFARMGLDSKQYEKSLDRLEGITQKKAMTLGSIFRGAFSFAIGIGVIQGFRSLGDAITDFVNTAARTEVLDVAMMAVAKATGTSTREIRAQEEALRDLGIAKQEAKQMLTRFMQAELDVADVTKLARVAQDAAVIAGYNSSQAAEQMTEAIAKQRPELLSAFGFTKNLNEIYNDYAKTVNKTAKQLSETEKKQAMLNYILAEGEKIAGTYEASMGAVGKLIGSLKRYWDDLKEAIAMPLALPPLKVIVDGITNALKNAISWAEANKVALQTWGQTAANVAGYIIRAFKYVGQIFAQNWALIRFVGIALLTYATATRIAAAATTIFKIASSVLKGTIAANVPILSALSIAINTYRLQVALAPVATNIFSAALYRLQAALYAVHAALGPIGWIILGLSAAVGVGTHLWGKYTQFVYSGAKIHEELAEGADQAGKSASDATGAIEDEADALKEAGKAAGKNLQSFDEVHQLQEDMAGSAEDLAESMGFDDTELGAPEAGGLEMPDIGAQLEEMKPTLTGFWEWIKLGAGKVWESVKRKWNSFVEWVKGWSLWSWIGKGWEGFITWVGNLWEGVKNLWSSFVEWVKGWSLWEWIGQAWETFITWAGKIWDGIKSAWEWFKDWVAEWAGKIWDGIKKAWEIFIGWAGKIWDGIKIAWGVFVSWAEKLWDGVKTKWEEFKDWVERTWNTLTGWLSEKWEEIKRAAETIWEAIKKNISEPIQIVWDWLIETWETVLTQLSEKWEEIEGIAKTAWDLIKGFITEPIQEAWDWLVETWDEIKDFLERTWDGIKTTAEKKWEGVKTVIKGAINGIIGFINKFIKAWNKIELKVPEIDIPLVGTVGGWTVSLPKIKEIPMLAKGGLVTAPTLAMIGEAGPEAVVPLGRSGFAEDLADTVAQAVYRAVFVDATGRIREWFVELPEVAIQAVGKVTDWITNLPEVAIQTVGEVTDWIISLPEVAVNATGRVTEWMFNPPEVFVDATGRIREWFVEYTDGR
jgi:hypothetical protein